MMNAGLHVGEHGRLKPHLAWLDVMMLLIGLLRQ
jgi:hypothetical protein